MNDVKDDDALAAIRQRLERIGNYIGQTGDGFFISAFDPSLSARYIQRANDVIAPRAPITQRKVVFFL